jgi:hypothetical protein
VLTSSAALETLPLALSGARDGYLEVNSVQCAVIL